MAQRPGQQSPSLHSPQDLQPEDFETLVQIHQKYPEEVVTRASRRALPEARRRSQRSDFSLSSYPSTSRSPSRMDFGGRTSATSSPQLYFSDTQRFSAASTSSSYSALSTAGESVQSGGFLAPPSRSGRLRSQASDATIEPLQATSHPARRPSTVIHDPSDSEDRPRGARRQDAVKNYVCTYCNKDFGGKSDWKRHETTFHEPQYIWQCPVCNRNFNSKRKFSTHHGRDHDCEDCDHQIEAQKTLPTKVAFGCGFQSCNQVLYSWDERCNHVAKHFEDGEMKANWQYTTMIKNLLRQEKLDEAWKRLLAETHGPRELWPQFSWRPEDTRDFKERLEYGNLGDIAELLQQVHRAGLAHGPTRSDIPGLPSPTLPSATEQSDLLNPFTHNEALASESRMAQLGVGTATMSPGHPILGAESYPASYADMSYYQTQTVTPPGDVVVAPSYQGLSAGHQGHVYQHMGYSEQVGFSQYPIGQAGSIAQPAPFPPVPSNNILASDAFYSPRPVPQTQRPSLPPQPHSAPPVPPTPPHSRARNSSSRQSLGKRLFGFSSRKSSGDHSSQRARSEQPLQSPIDSIDGAYLPGGYHPDTFF